MRTKAFEMLLRSFRMSYYRNGAKAGHTHTESAIKAKHVIDPDDCIGNKFSELYSGCRHHAKDELDH